MNRLAHVLYSGLGGHGAVLFALLEANFLPDTEHRVIFVGVEEPRTEYVQRCNALNIPWSYVRVGGGRSAIGLVASILGLLRGMKPDQIFCHGPASVPSVCLYKLLSRKRVFSILRDTQAHHLKSLRDWLLLFLADMFFDKIVYLTREAQVGARAKLGRFSRKSSVVIGNGLDIDYFAPTSSSALTDTIRIGMQSRLQPNKDHLTLINGFLSVAEKHPERRMILEIAGDGQTRRDLEKYVDKVGLRDRVSFRGMLDQGDLREFLGNLDIYVHCTHGETMSTAIMQALSMGLPVIASDVWGVSNMLADQRGLLYRPGDCRDLSEKIEWLLADAATGRSMSERGRDYAVEEFSDAKLAKRYSAIFDAIE